MGKIRVRTLGDEQTEKEQLKEAKKRKEAKKTAKAPGMKGGERIVAVGPSEEELAKLHEKTSEKPEEAKVLTEEKKEKKEKSAKKKTKPRSKKYQAIASLVDKKKQYSLTEALALLPKLTLSSFDETVELHLNMTEQGISGNVVLPHGTGKKTRIAIINAAADPKHADELIKNIENGKFDFDVLIATPDSMPKLAKVAKFLGPRGLMPNPKNGTVTAKPEEKAKQLASGQISFKTEAKFPVIHMSVGKISFGAQKLAENINQVLSVLPKNKIKSITLKSTMSPGINLAVPNR
jgi:large subunit ribosomal protein L1